MKRFLWLVLAFVCLAPLFGAEDYRITDWRMDVTVDRAATYHVDQTMAFRFDTPRHGFYQEIPLRFGNKRVTLEHIASSDPLTVDEVDRNWATFRVGDADRMVVGPKTYRITYDYGVGDDGRKDYDEVYFDLVGTAWRCPVDRFTFTVRLPKPAPGLSAWLAYGTEGSADLLPLEVSADGTLVSGSAEDLGEGKGLTIRIQLPQGYFDQIPYRFPWGMAASVLAFAVGMALVLFAYRSWSVYGRDDPLVPVVDWKAPDGLAPLEVGYLADGAVDAKDLASMLFYWADQGCLTIAGNGKGGWVFTKVKDPVTPRPFELGFFHDLFSCGKDGVVSSSDLACTRFSKACDRAGRETRMWFSGERSLKDAKASSRQGLLQLLAVVPAVLGAIGMNWEYPGGALVGMLALGLFTAILWSTATPSIVRRWRVRSKVGLLVGPLFGSAVIAFVMGCIIAFVGPGLSRSLLAFATCFACPLAIAVLGGLTEKRSAYGTRLLGGVLGMRSFIEAVEVPRLKRMLDEDPSFYWRVLSYAIALGLERTWAKRAASLVPRTETAPWYVGPDPMDLMLYDRLVRGVRSSVSRGMVYTEASRGGRSPGVHSSFGSSGHVGGGFGGGGGGAW